MDNLAHLKRPHRTAPAAFIDREVMPDVVFISKEGTKHEAHLVAVASRVEYFQRKMGLELGQGSGDSPSSRSPTSTTRKRRLKTETSGRCLELFLRWVYKGDLKDMKISSALESLKFADTVGALEWAYDIHDWANEKLPLMDERDVFRLLAATFSFVHYDFAVKYIEVLLKRGVDFGVGAFNCEGYSDDVGIWGIRMMAAAMRPAGHSPKGKKAETVSHFQMSSYSDLRLKSQDGSTHPTCRAFWAQCPELREPLMDPTVTTLKLDADSETLNFLVKLINGEEIRNFNVEIFKKVYKMAHQYDLQKVLESMGSIAFEIFRLDTQFSLVAWSAEVPRGDLGPRLASWLWKDLKFDTMRDNAPGNMTSPGSMAVKLGLTLRTLPEGRWKDFAPRAHRGLTFLHVEDHRLVWFV